MANKINSPEKKVRLFVDKSHAVLSLERVKQLNALDAEMLSDIVKLIRLVSSRENIRLLTIKSKSEKAFVAGADITYMDSLGQGALDDFIELGSRAMLAIESCPFPVVAAVQGFALGGGLELALACDFIVSSESSIFGLPEVKLGLIPGFGGTQRLMLKVGASYAKRMIFSGCKIDAKTAKSVGIVDELYADDEFDSLLSQLEEEIISNAPLAVSKAKDVINYTVEAIQLVGLRKEIDAFRYLFSTRDREEGFDSFLEKRKPVFTGK